MPDHGHHPGRQKHEADRRQRDRAHTVAQGVEIGEEGGRVQERRQEDDEHQVGIELDLGKAGNQPQRQPAEHERDGVGDGQPARERVQPRDRHEQRRQDDLEILHAGILACLACGR